MIKKGRNILGLFFLITLIPLVLAVAPGILFNSQFPADINTGNALNSPLNITYNITGEINLSTVKIYFKSNTSSMDFSRYINGTAQERFQNRTYTSNESKVFLFQLYDNHVYPETENIANGVFRVTSHKNVTIDAWNHAVRVELLNVSNSSRYGFFEIMIEKEHTWTSVGQVLYCNSSYSTGYFLADDNCVSFYSLRVDDYDHSHSSLSKHVVIPFSVNETTGMVGDVKVTPKSSFIVRASGPYGWVAYYIENKTRTGASQTTTSAGTSWTELEGTFDSHLHQFDGTDEFYHYACAEDNSGNENCSEIQKDLYILGGLPPTGMDVFSPERNSGFKENITINYTEPQSPNGYEILNYDISYGYENGTKIGDIKSNILNTSYVWDISLIDEGKYFLVIEACDNMSQCTNTTSGDFYIDRTDPSVSFSCSDSSVNTGSDLICTCSATDSLSGVNSTNYTQNPSTSTTGTFTTTCTATDNAGNSVSSSLSYTVSSSGGGGIPGANTYNHASKNLSENYKINKWMWEKDKIKFKSGGFSHDLEVLEILKDTIKIVVKSEPFEFVLSENESKKIDLDGDGFYDILVKCNKILEDRAKIEMMGIEEKVPASAITNKNDSEENYSNLDEEKVSKSNILLYTLLAITSFVVIYFLQRFLASKKRILK